MMKMKWHETAGGSDVPICIPEWWRSTEKGGRRICRPVFLYFRNRSYFALISLM